MPSIIWNRPSAETGTIPFSAAADICRTTKKKCLELLLSKRVDGVILAGSQYIESKPQDNNYLLEAAKQLPIMLVNGALEGKGIYSTICDDRTAIFKAANSLMISGHSHILLLY